MKNVLLTGHSSGIGKAIKELLSENGYNIIELKSRLENLKLVENEVKEILKKEKIDVLINCAGIGEFKPHEEIKIDKIQELIAINLTAPIVLSKLLLRSFKENKNGHIINISSIEALRHSKFSALYTATKSGLRDFSLSLFEEVRKSNVKVTSINPDITKTNFFDNLSFTYSENEKSFICPTAIAKAVFDILANNYVITDFTIRPQIVQIGKKTQNK